MTGPVTVEIPVLPAQEKGNPYLSLQQNASDPFAWTGAYEMSDAEIDELVDPDWAYPNLIITGHLIVIPAPPNGGKTTIFEWVCSQVASYYRVIYVNADISGGDAKTAHRKAREGGYTLLLPDMKSGLSMDDVVANLVHMNESGADLSRVLMVFDTLKKMVDVISKQKSRELYKVLRGLTAKGMTIVLLAHTNKHKGDDGKPIFEGTGDLRSDVDEMIYLLPIKHDDGSMTVSTDPDKVRGDFQPITFEIGPPPDRVVRQIGHIDVAGELRYETQLKADADDLATIEAILKRGALKQTEIVEHCKPEGLSRRRVLKLLKRYAVGERARLVCRRGTENNAAIYALKTEPGYIRK